jgi:hypothetical protein
MTTARVLAATTMAAAFAAVLATSSACGLDECTPDDFELGDATRLPLRTLPGLTYTGACKHPRLAILSSEEELRAFYEELRVAPSHDGGTDTAEIKFPAVDFTRERVLVSESDSGESMGWAVARNDTAFVGLLRCRGTSEPTCVVRVATVSSLATSVESRKCEPVACGNFRQSPAARH